MTHHYGFPDKNPWQYPAARLARITREFGYAGLE